MKRNALPAFAFLIVALFSFQTVSAQFPRMPKIPKPNQPKPQPTPSAQPTPSEDATPAERPGQPDTRATTKPTAAAATGGEVFAKQPQPTGTLQFLVETLEIRTDTQDYYWKLPKESNYTSWTPSLRFNALYGGSMRLRLKADYFMPDGQLWFSESLEQRGNGDAITKTISVVSEAVPDKDKDKALTTGGTFGVKITDTRNSETIFQGKFKVAKFKPPTADARFKNLFGFYVEHDWSLPVGHADLEWSERVTATPRIRMWFKGGINTEDLEARLFHNGQQIATTDDGGQVGSVERRFPKGDGYNPALIWNLYEFDWRRKIQFIADPQARDYTSNKDLVYINQMPGEYTVKVFYKGGDQIRETKFSIADGNFADNGIAKQSKLSTNKVILPVKVMGTADKWNAATWKTDTFYGNTLVGFNLP